MINGIQWSVRVSTITGTEQIKPSLLSGSRVLTGTSNIILLLDWCVDRGRELVLPFRCYKGLLTGEVTTRSSAAAKRSQSYRGTPTWALYMETGLFLSLILRLCVR